MGEVIEARRWRNQDGRTASFMGAVPSLNPEADGWAVEVWGYTVRHPDGTTGLGRPPFATREAAQAWVDAHPTFKGMSQ